MDKLKAWLELTGVTQEQLALDMEVSRQSIHNWLTGRSTPNAHMLRKLHERTSLPLDDLVPKADVA